MLDICINQCVNKCLSYMKPARNQQHSNTDLMYTMARIWPMKATDVSMFLRSLFFCSFREELRPLTAALNLGLKQGEQWVCPE
jgi:hypothetical protein